MDGARTSDEGASQRPWKALIAGFGFVLPYAVIVLGWSFAPRSIREHYNPDGERAGNQIMQAVIGSTLVGVFLVLPWALSRRRPSIWWAGAVVAVAVQAVGVCCFNLWYYLLIGGAFP